MMVAADNMSGERLQKAMAVINASPKAKDRFRVLAGIDFRNVGPGWAEKAIAQLEADAAAGAVGVGEIGKSFGLSTKKADGSRLKLDDPDLDPIWDACARLKLPVFIHTGDPQELLPAYARLHERTVARAVALPGATLPSRQSSAIRGAHGRAGQSVPQASEDDVRRRTPGLARERPRSAGQDARRDA
jgi:hypothetical protein